MVSAKKLGIANFLAMLLSITVALPVRAQTPTPPAQRDEKQGTKESAEGLNLLFGEQAKQVGMTLPEVKKIYEDAGKKFVNSLGEALYNRFAGAKPFWMLALRCDKAALYEKHHELKLPFRPGRPLEMKEVYVPVKVSGKGAQTADTLIDAYPAIEKHKKLVVLGAPGAGKSILLKHVALTCAERDLDAVRDWFAGWWPFLNPVK